MTCDNTAKLDSFLKLIKQFENEYLKIKGEVLHFSRKVVVETFEIHSGLGLHECRGHTDDIVCVFDGGARVIMSAKCCGEEFLSFEASRGCIFYDSSNESHDSYPDKLFRPTEFVNNEIITCDLHEFVTRVLVCTLAASQIDEKTEDVNTYLEALVNEYVRFKRLLNNKNVKGIQTDCAHFQRVLARPGFQEYNQGDCFRICRTRKV